MHQWAHCYLLAGLIWTATLLEVSFSEVYTSSRKIEVMVLQEEDILNQLQAAITETNNASALLSFVKFRERRILEVKERGRYEDLQSYLNHPNALYHSIVEFATEYKELRSALGNMTSPNITKCLSKIADDGDVIGARRSLIRLQNIYNLEVRNMIKGDYLGYLGPELGEIDSIDIGVVAYADGYLKASLAWLHEALTTTIADPNIENDHPEVPTLSRADILALMGGVYVRQGRLQKAQKMYKQAKLLGPTEAHVLKLERELNTTPQTLEPSYNDVYFKGMCPLPHKLTNQQYLDPRLNCVYRAAPLPYYRFQEELLSVSPYITVFYNFLTGSESDTLVTSATEQLERAQVQFDEEFETSEYRTSECSLLQDSESALEEAISKRIGAVTYLDTWKYPTPFERLFSAEPLQIVNYGIGGHYSVHTDMLLQVSESGNPDLHNMLRLDGNRISTFLIYLSDVAAGGATIFPLADVSVRPVKNMAVFWYNYKPSGKDDHLTLHAGCPVVIGHKWVANKWIYSNANTFTRRCGLKMDANQLDINPYMDKGWN